jgi:hypothetical protein
MRICHMFIFNAVPDLYSSFYLLKVSMPAYFRDASRNAQQRALATTFGLQESIPIPPPSNYLRHWPECMVRAFSTRRHNLQISTA